MKLTEKQKNIIGVVGTIVIISLVGIVGTIAVSKMEKPNNIAIDGSDKSVCAYLKFNQPAKGLTSYKNAKIKIIGGVDSINKNTITMGEYGYTITAEVTESAARGIEIGSALEIEGTIIAIDTKSLKIDGKTTIEEYKSDEIKEKDLLVNSNPVDVAIPNGEYTDLEKIKGPASKSSDKLVEANKPTDIAVTKSEGVPKLTGTSLVDIKSSITNDKLRPEVKETLDKIKDYNITNIEPITDGIKESKIFEPEPTAEFSAGEFKITFKSADSSGDSITIVCQTESKVGHLSKVIPGMTVVDGFISLHVGDFDPEATIEENMKLDEAEKKYLITQLFGRFSKPMTKSQAEYLNTTKDYAIAIYYNGTRR